MSVESEVESKVEDKYKNDKDVDIILGDRYSFDQFNS